MEKEKTKRLRCSLCFLVFIYFIFPGRPADSRRRARCPQLRAARVAAVPINVPHHIEQFRVVRIASEPGLAGGQGFVWLAQTAMADGRSANSLRTIGVFVGCGSQVVGVIVGEGPVLVRADARQLGDVAKDRPALQTIGFSRPQIRRYRCLW